MKKSEVQKIITKELLSMGDQIQKLETANTQLKKQVNEVSSLKKLNDSILTDNKNLKNEIEKINEKLAFKEMEFQISKKRIDEFNEFFVLKDMTISANMNRTTSSTKQEWGKNSGYKKIKI